MVYCCVASVCVVFVLVFCGCRCAVDFVLGVCDSLETIVVLCACIHDVVLRLVLVGALLFFLCMCVWVYLLCYSSIHFIVVFTSGGVGFGWVACFLFGVVCVFIGVLFVIVVLCVMRSYGVVSVVLLLRWWFFGLFCACVGRLF